MPPTPPTYDFEIDVAMDFVPDIDVYKKAATTGELAAYSGITGVTMLISATRGSSTAINAALSQSASERASTAGRIYATFDVADLQTHLLPLVGQTVWLNVYKSGELAYEPFRCLVRQDRIG